MHASARPPARQTGQFCGGLLGPSLTVMGAFIGHRRVRWRGVAGSEIGRPAAAEREKVVSDAARQLNDRHVFGDLVEQCTRFSARAHITCLACSHQLSTPSHQLLSLQPTEHPK